MRCYKVDKGGTAEVIEIEATLDAFYKAIGCDCIDITIRMVEGHPFEVIVDDNGWFGNPIVTAIDARAFEANLVGTLLVFGCGDEEVRGLTDEEVEILEDRTYYVANQNHRELLIVD